MKKISILVLIGILSLNSVGLAVEEKGRVNKTIGKIVNKVRTKSENINSNTSNRKKSIFNKILKRDDESSWQLVWSDEFNGDKLDLSKWSYWENDYPSKNGNFVDENGNLVDQYGFKAKQYYLRDNVKVKDGNLVIEVKKENNKTVKIDGVDRKILYSSGAVHTKDKYDVKYGKIEMRAAMPKGIGVWPAFWTWPSDYAIRKIGDPAALEEIDIVEISGDNLREVTGTIHALKADSQYASFVGKDLTIKKNEDLSNFNTYAVEWNEKEIKWFFNGRNYKTVTMKEDRKSVV